METLGAMPDLRRRKAAGALFQKEFLQIHTFLRGTMLYY